MGQKRNIREKHFLETNDIKEWIIRIYEQESSTIKEVHNNTNLHQETSKLSNKQFNFTLIETRKRKTDKT